MHLETLVTSKVVPRSDLGGFGHPSLLGRSDVENRDAYSFSRRISYLLSRNKLEEDIISDMLEAMINTDPDECFERWICDVATHEETYWDMHPFLKFASDDEDIFVPKRFGPKGVLRTEGQACPIS